MYLEHFGLTEPPFRITPHTDFFFAGANRGATLEALIYTVTHDEGIVKISGEVGSGKTMLCRVLIERLPAKVAIVYLSNPSLSRADILYAIADELRIELPENARASAVLRSLQDHLIRLYGEGRRVVVLIDEAHAMPTETLEEIRLLSNLESNHSKLLQLVLFGQPELNDILARPDMRQLKERITHNFPLEPLVRGDIAEYMEFRMRAAGYRGPNVFSPSANKIIAETSQGLTRRINMLADKSLLAAFSENTHQITAKHVRAAVKDCDFSKATRITKPMPLRTAALLAIFFLAAVWLTLSNPWFSGKGEMSTPDKASAVPSLPITVTPPLPVSPPAAVATPQPLPPQPLPQPVSPQLISPQPTAPAPQPAPSQVLPAMKVAPPQPATPVPASLPIAPIAPMVPQVPARAKSALENNLDAGKTWLAGVDNNRWFLQLATEANHPATVEAYLRTIEKSGVAMANVRVYLSDLSGALRYGIIYGDYPSRSSAMVAAKNLPAKVRERHPYPRQVIRLR